MFSNNVAMFLSKLSQPDVKAMTQRFKNFSTKVGKRERILIHLKGTEEESKKCKIVAAAVVKGKIYFYCL